MAVYVDDAFIPAKVGRLNSRWCHMMADTKEELLAMAKKIGLKPEWIQYPDTWKEHFDLTENKRKQAVRAGVIEVESRSEEHRAWIDERIERYGRP